MTSQAEKQKRQMENSDDNDDTETEIVGDVPDVSETITDFGQLQPRQQSLYRWTVLNLKPDDDSNTAHYVDTRELDCSCRDHEYNREDGEVCKHLAVALWAADRNVDADALSRWSIQQELSTAREAAEKVEHLSHYLETVAGSLDGEAASEAVENAESGGETTSGTTAAEQNGNAEEAAHKLQAAFDEVIDDMQVQANDGLVWFQTGQDTPDDWPFPGGDQTFKVVTQPDSVMYVHDGSDDWADGPHKHYDSKPGEWWKNALEPSEVDDYIAEVLE